MALAVLAAGVDSPASLINGIPRGGPHPRLSLPTDGRRLPRQIPLDTNVAVAFLGNGIFYSSTIFPIFVYEKYSNKWNYLLAKSQLFQAQWVDVL